MNKAQLVAEVSERTETSKHQVEKILDSAIEVIRESVKNGKGVKLIGFGTFTKVMHKARKGRHPQTGKSIEIPAVWVPKFRSGSEFRDMIRKEGLSN